MAAASGHRSKTTRWPGRHRRAPGRFYSEAAWRLWGVLARRKLSAAEAATRVGVSTTAVLRWLYGDRVPDRTCAASIRSVFGIDTHLWDVALQGKLAEELPTMRLFSAA